MRGPASDAPPQGAVACFAFLDAQHLRIVEPVAQRFREAAEIENHSRCDHRPGKRPAPGLVDAADQPRAAPLDPEIRHPNSPRGLCHKGANRARAGWLAYCVSHGTAVIAAMVSSLLTLATDVRQAAALCPALAITIED